MQKAKFVNEVTVIDPDTNLEVNISIFKHENGGMFGIDSSYYQQVPDENDKGNACITDPLNYEYNVIELIED